MDWVTEGKQYQLSAGDMSCSDCLLESITLEECPSRGNLLLDINRVRLLKAQKQENLFRTFVL